MVVDRSWKAEEGYRVLRSYQGSRQLCIKARLARIWELDFKYAQGPKGPQLGITHQRRVRWYTQGSPECELPSQDM